MAAYKHILAAVDVTEEGHNILGRAHLFSKSFDARLTVLHVVDFFPTAGVMSGPIDLSEQRAEQAKGTLRGWCEELGIAATQLQVVIGTPITEVLRATKEQDIDLLVIGHHPHRGLSLLLSHTDQAVLSRASCDVLAVAQKAGG